MLESEDEGIMTFTNIRKYLPNNRASHPRRLNSSTALLSVSQILQVDMFIYSLIHKSLQDFRPLRYSSRDGHAKGEHVNIGRDIPSFCSTLQVLDMSTLGDAAGVNLVIKFLPHTCNVCGRNVIAVNINRC